MTMADVYRLAGAYAEAAFRAFGSRLAELEPEDRRRLADEILDAALTDAEIVALERASDAELLGALRS